MARNPSHYVGLPARDWHQLKDAVLGAALAKGKKRQEWLEELPHRLQDHPVAKLVRQYLDTNKQRYLNEAATALTGDCDQPWLVLMKS